MPLHDGNGYHGPFGATQEAPPTYTSAPPPPPPLMAPGTGDSASRPFALALLPFTPVQFGGQDSLLAYGRIALYGIAAGLTWEKHRKLSYVFAGAAGLSLVTSLSANAWKK